MGVGLGLGLGLGVVSDRGYVCDHTLVPHETARSGMTSPSRAPFVWSRDVNAFVNPDKEF